VPELRGVIQIEPPQPIPSLLRESRLPDGQSEGQPEELAPYANRAPLPLGTGAGWSSAKLA